MNIREDIEKRENNSLNIQASFSEKTKGRKINEERDSLRTEYMRDRDRIIHCESFRRLKHKTQVFLSSINEHFRTRLTHTLEVSQIARTITRALRYNEDLTEAIALGHDVGHTPFGHTGEEVIRELAYPNFRHSEQSVRVLTVLEKKRKGLNLTSEVLDGILKHSKTGSKHINPQGDNEYPMTLEGEIVRISDTIAYVNHDIDDAILSGILNPQDIPESCRLTLGDSHSSRVNRMVIDVIENSIEKNHIGMSEEVLSETEKLRNYLFGNVYCDERITEEMDKAKKILFEIFQYLRKNLNIVQESLFILEYNSEEEKKQSIVDYIALMTDHEAIKLFTKTYIPKSFYIFSG